ncbi:MAG: site-specific integrase [Terriglobales bacterium]
MRQPYSEQELLAILTAAKEHGARSHAMVLCAYLHGVRASEVCGLRLSDLDTQNWQLRIARLKGSLLSVQAVTSFRGQPLLDEQKTLKTWLAVRPTDAGDALFPSQKGGCMDRSQFYRVFAEIAERAGLPEGRRNCHQLKHAIASHLIKADMNLAKVQVALGHRSISSTMKYVSVSDHQADAARHDALLGLNWRAVGGGA